MKKLLTAFSFCLLTCTLSFSQSDDFGIWSGIRVSRKVEKKNKILLEAGLRLNNNSSQIQNLFFQPGFSRKINDNIKLSYNYRIANKTKYDNKSSIEHRNEINLSASKKIVKDITISNRSRLQTKLKNINSSENGRLIENYFRNKTTVEYKFSKKFKPYLSTEFFLPLKASNKFTIDQNRYYIGSKIKLNKEQELKVYYLIKLEQNKVNPTNNYILGVEYRVNI